MRAKKPLVHAVAFFTCYWGQGGLRYRAVCTCLRPWDTLGSKALKRADSHAHVQNRLEQVGMR